jgi:Skp family chaperone for outer membrane proteins
MKHFLNQVFNALVFLLMVSFFLACSEKKETKKSTPPKVEVRDMKGLKIAFYYSDSLKEDFTYFKEQEAIVTKKQKQFQAVLQGKQKAYESFILRNNEKLKNGLLSDNEQMQLQQQAQRMEADIMQYQQNQGVKLEKETMDKLEAISKKVEAWGKKFCEENGIDMLLIHGAGGQINFIDSSMDVTKSFTEYLNEHQKEIEQDLKKK